MRGYATASAMIPSTCSKGRCGDAAGNPRPRRSHVYGRSHRVDARWADRTNRNPRELYCAPQDPFVVTFFGDVNELQGKVHNGAVNTPVGRVPAPGLAEGSDAQIMIRPEALRIVERDLPAGEHGHSHVVMAKLLGRTSLLHLCAHGENGLEAHLHARVPGVFLPAEGQPVDIHLDLSQVFVFPLTA